MDADVYHDASQLVQSLLIAIIVCLLYGVSQELSKIFENLKFTQHVIEAIHEAQVKDQQDKMKQAKRPRHEL